MEIKSVGLITYHFPHLKTEQVLQRLLKESYRFKFFALPYTARPERTILFNHRPDQTEAVAPESLAEKHEIPYIKCASDADIDDSCDLYLLLGGGLISREGLKGKRIINCHPGIIPVCRGLDAFKWAVYEMKPLGATLHYIDAEADAGEIISVVPTNVYKSDSLVTLARRHYENEINCLAGFANHLRNPQNQYAGQPRENSKKRIPLANEKQLAAIFDNYTEKYGSSG